MVTTPFNAKHINCPGTTQEFRIETPVYIGKYSFVSIDKVIPGIVRNIQAKSGNNIFLRIKAIFFTIQVMTRIQGSQGIQFLINYIIHPVKMIAKSEVKGFHCPKGNSLVKTVMVELHGLYQG